MSVFFTRAALFYIFTTFWGPPPPPLFFFFPRVPRGCLPKTGGGVWKLARKNSIPRFYNVSIGRTDTVVVSQEIEKYRKRKGPFFSSLQDDGFPCRRSGSPISPYPFFLFWGQNLPPSRPFPTFFQWTKPPHSSILPPDWFPLRPGPPPLSSTWVRNFSDPSARYSLFSMAGQGDPF